MDFWPAYQPVGADNGEGVVALARMIAARGIPARGPRTPLPQTNYDEAHLYVRVADTLNPAPDR